jgi:hypothetical protein
MIDSELRSIASELIAAAVPHELPLLDDIFEALERPVTSLRDDPLGSGVGDSWVWSQMASPTLIAVAVWMTKDVLGKAASDVLIPRVKALVQRMLDQRPGASTTRTLQAEDYKTIAAVVEVVKRNATERGLRPEQTSLLCQSVATKLEATLVSLPASEL